MAAGHAGSAPRSSAAGVSSEAARAEQTSWDELFAQADTAALLKPDAAAPGAERTLPGADAAAAWCCETVVGGGDQQAPDVACAACAKPSAFLSGMCTTGCLAAGPARASKKTSTPACVAPAATPAAAACCPVATSPSSGCCSDACPPGCDDSGTSPCPGGADAVVCPGSPCTEAAPCAGDDCEIEPCPEPCVDGCVVAADGCPSVCDGFVPPNSCPEAPSAACGSKTVTNAATASLPASTNAPHAPGAAASAADATSGMYGGFDSFQELLDCCCCTDVYPAQARGAASTATDSGMPRGAPAPCGTDCVTSCGTTPGASTSASVLSPASVEQPRSGTSTPMRFSDSASSMLASSTRARSFSLADFSSGGPSTATSCFSAGNTPHTLDADWSVLSPGRHGKQREQYGEHAPAHSYFALPGATAHNVNHRQHAQQSTAACAQQPPHQHNDAGFCLPPAMTLCNSSHCGGEWHAHGQQSTRTPAHQSHHVHRHPFPFAPSQGRNGWESVDFSQRNSPMAAPHTPSAETHVCQWAGCGHQASSIAELVAHVHFAHLAGPQPSAPSAQAQPQPQVGHFAQAQAAPATQQMQPPQQVCLWDSCSNAAPNTAHDAGGAGVLQHLLTAHLGRADSDPSALLAAFFGGGEQVSASSPPVAPSAPRTPAYTAADIPTGKRRRLTHAAESIVHKSAPSHLDRAAAGLSSTTSPHATPSSSKRATPALDNGGAHRCGWVGCGQLFDSHAALTEHLGAAHVGNGHTEYACGWEGCERARSGQTFSQRQKVMRHLQTHTGDRPHQCAECGKRFSEPTTLAQHMRTHTGARPYACDHPGCTAAFSVAGSLTIHKRTHTGEKPFQCKFCPRSFSESSNLTKHMRTHTLERPFVCPECGRGFSRPDQVSRHRKVHLKERERAAASASASARSSVGSSGSEATSSASASAKAPSPALHHSAAPVAP